MVDADRRLASSVLGCRRFAAVGDTFCRPFGTFVWGAYTGGWRRRQWAVAASRLGRPSSGELGCVLGEGQLLV